MSEQVDEQKRNNAAEALINILKDADFVEDREKIVSPMIPASNLKNNPSGLRLWYQKPESE